MRPGTNHFFVCEYDVTKKVKAIDVYQIRSEAQQYSAAKKPEDKKHKQNT